jgi:hypothetical protein
MKAESLIPYSKALEQFRQGHDVRQDVLRLAPGMAELTKDFREIFAWCAAEKMFPGDTQILAQLGQHLKTGLKPEQVPFRVGTMLDALAQPNNPHSNKETFGFLAEAQAILIKDDPRPLGKKNSLTVANLARYYVAAKSSNAAKSALARGLYAHRDELTKPAATLFDSRAWIRSIIDTQIAGYEPEPKWNGVWATMAQSWRNTVAAVRELQPAFVFFTVAVLLSVVLFLVATAGKKTPPSPAAVAVAHEAESPVAPTTAEPTVFQQFARALAPYEERLKDYVILVAPRSHDDSDKILAETLASHAKYARVIPWTETRRLLGDHSPTYSAHWLTADEMERVRTIAGDDKTRLLYADIEPLTEGLARVSLFSLNPIGVVLTVTGTAPGVQATRDSDWLLQQAKAEFQIDTKSPMVALRIRQAHVAATSNIELGRVYLFEGQMHLCLNNDKESETAMVRAYALLPDAERTAIPDPLRDKIAKEFLTAEARIRRERLELRQVAAPNSQPKSN